MNPEAKAALNENPEWRLQVLEAEKEKLSQETARLREENKRLEQLAYFDAKTGVLNLNGLKRELEAKNLGRQENGKTAAGSMLVLDVDNFKVINDLFGHPVGDQVLRAVAERLRGIVKRKTDLVARWGGEEFVVVFDKTDEEGIMAKFFSKKEGEAKGRPRLNVPTLIENREVNITLSGGVSDFRLDEDMDEVFKRADEALYKAKQEGKDRILSAGSLAEEKEAKTA